MKTIFITGATRGIGRETASLFAGRGWRVLGCGRDQHLIEETNTALGHPHQIFRMDVTNENEVRMGIETLMQVTDGKGPDVLLNNAGYQELGPVEDISKIGRAHV